MFDIPGLELIKSAELSISRRIDIQKMIDDCVFASVDPYYRGIDQMREGPTKATLCLARIVPEKNYFALGEMMKKAQKKYPGIRGAYPRELLTFIAQHGKKVKHSFVAHDSIAYEDPVIGACVAGVDVDHRGLKLVLYASVCGRLEGNYHCGLFTIPH